MKMHKSITMEKLMDACNRRMSSLDNPGFCVACGNEQEGCEPDARKYQCEGCGEYKVYGSDELLMMIA